ncbi:YtjB family periplasmic protein [Shewanella sp. YIC-542]|uniref:YtjB family periplasmic protein n=1 Tax=Shewanella mytili TaxID=3377111 RepID=UPI00398F076F
MFDGLKTTHTIIRLLQIALAVTLIVALVQLWQTSLLQGQLLLKSQTEMMARLLVQQTAYGAAPALRLQNDEQLQWLTTALVEDPKVMAATIYNDEGQRMSFDQDVTDEAINADDEALQALLAPYPPYVESVIQEGKNLGFIEVRLNPQLFLNEIKAAHEQNMQQQQIMLLMAGIIGMLLSRALSLKRARFVHRRTRIKRQRKAVKKQAEKHRQSAGADNDGDNDNSGALPPSPPEEATSP